MFKQLSKSTKNFLRPFNTSYDSLDNCILQIDVSPVKDKFIVQVYEEYEKEELVKIDSNTIATQFLGNTSIANSSSIATLTKDQVKSNYERKVVTHRRIPHHYEASNFADRFVHGHKMLLNYRPGIFYPVFECPTTDLSVALFMDVWQGKKLLSPRAKDLIGTIIAREAMANIAELRTAAFFEKDAQGNSKFIPDPNSELLVYQQVAALNACMLPSYLLLKDMGTGKTAVAIKKIKRVVKDCVKNNGRPAKILIAVPKSLLLNWRTELNTWALLSYEDRVAGKKLISPPSKANPNGVEITDAIHAKVVTLAGANEITRMICMLAALHYDKDFKQLPELSDYSCQLEHEAHIVIANYDAIVGTPCLWDKEQYAQRTEWDLIVVDEIHNICNPRTARCKTFLALRESATHKLGLTGTPVRNTPFDIWAPFEFLGHGYSGFDTHKDFKEFHGNWIQIPGKGISLLKSYENMAMMKERISKYSFSITLKEAAPFLPDITYDIRTVRMTPEQTEFYNALVEELVAKFSHLDEDDAMTVNNVLTQMLRLAQITSGFAMMDTTGVTRFDPNPKLDELIDIIKEEQEPTRKFQIWSCFKESIKHIRARLELEGLACVQYHGDMSKEEKDISVNRFNCDRTMPIIIGTQAAGKEGLNLVGFDPQNPNAYDTNCDRAIYFCNNWSGVDRAQSSKRMYRLITRVPVRITDLLVDHSIDTTIYERITGKIEMIHSLRDVKNILNAAFYNKDLDE